MDLVVVNGASAISRGVLKKLVRSKKYQKIRLLDFRPYRRSVYAFQSALPQGVTLEKVQTQTAAELEVAFEGATDLLYFTHDYVAQTADKNNFLATTARLSKKHGVERLVAVCPIEHDLYYTEDKNTPLELKAEARSKALAEFSNMTVLNPSLVFGPDSYFLHYLTQCVKAGKAPAAFLNSQNRYQYSPVHQDDLGRAVEKAFEQLADAKGQQFSVKGITSFPLKEIINHLENATGQTKDSTKAQNQLIRSIGEFATDFFVGSAHDNNMVNMVKYFESHQGDNSTASDFGIKFNEKPEIKFEDYCSKRVEEESLVHPIFTNYKMVSLD